MNLSNRLNCQNGLYSLGMQMTYIFAQCTRTNILIWKYVDKQIIEQEYMNIYHWEFDLSMPVLTLVLWNFG